MVVSVWNTRNTRTAMTAMKNSVHHCTTTHLRMKVVNPHGGRSMFGTDQTSKAKTFADDL